MIRSLALALALLPSLASAAGEAPVPARPVAVAMPADAKQPMTQTEYKKGLETLRGYLEKRGEDPTVAERFIVDLQHAFRVPPGASVPVTRGVFEAFLKNEAAWARKTRDSKNPDVSPADREHEVQRSKELRATFKKEAAVQAPRFYRAFQAAVKDVRALQRGDGKDYAGNSAVFFGDQVDASYTHVDAGDEALQNGDPATATAEADQALAANPDNADALVLRSGAEYDAGNTAAAVSDAQAALALDPENQQAQAVVSLAAASPDAAAAALASAASGGASLASDGAAAALPTLGVPVGASALPTVAAPNPYATSASAPPAAPVRYAPPTTTPSVGRLLSADLGARAVNMASVDPRASLSQLGRAMALDPGNASARGWQATLANRVGDYSAALGSAEQGLASDPNDAHSFFNKAYALAGTGDKDGMMNALAQAARIDPSYRPVLSQAAALDPRDALTQLFGSAATQHQPAFPQPRRHHRHLHLPWVFGGLGALMVFAAGALFFRPSVARPAVTAL